MANKGNKQTIMKQPHACNLRKGRFSQAGYVYLITVVTRQRQPLFADFQNARTVIRALQIHEQKEFAQTICYVVMPDHLHWLMQLGEKKDLSETIRTLKSVISRKIGTSVFQKGFYDHALRRDEDMKNIARYIVANPLRAGLVDNINDYSHWDAIWMNDPR